MNSHKTTVRTRPKCLSILAASLGLAFALPSQAENRAGAFEMLVFEDSIQGQYLIEGDVDKALAQSEQRNMSRFSALNDRCVSLTLARELEKADVVCNDAIREARRSVPSYAPGSVHRRGTALDSRSRRAMALTNRGVLHALQGEGELAREDFAVAAELNSKMPAAKANLAVLEGRLTVAALD